MPNVLLTFILALLAMIGPLGIDTYLPSFPAIAEAFKVGPVVVQQTLSVYIAALACTMLFYGTLSDSFGRRSVLLVSLTLFTLTSFAAAFAPSIEWLLTIRALQGMSAGAGAVIGRAMVQDRFQGAEAQRVMSLITMVFGLAPAIAPIIGGFLQVNFGWRAIFVFLALFGIFLLSLCGKLLPETLSPAKRQPFNLRTICANYARSLRHPQFILMAFSIGLVYSGVSLYVGSAAAFIMNILKLPETAFAWLFLPLIAGMMCGAAIAGTLSHRVPPRILIRYGFGIMLVAVMFSVGYTSLFPVNRIFAVLPLTLYTFGLALCSPSMIVITLGIFPDMRGLAASMQGFIQMILFSLVTGLIAPLLFDSAQKLAFGHAIGICLGMVLWVAAYFIRRRQQAEHVHAG